MTIFETLFVTALVAAALFAAASKRGYFFRGGHDV
jgi:hypothetical protein